MLNPFDIIELIKQFIPPHKQNEIQDRIIDMLANAFPNEHGRKLIQAYRSDAEFKAALATALKRAVEKFIPMNTVHSSLSPCPTRTQSRNTVYCISQKNKKVKSF